MTLVTNPLWVLKTRLQLQSRAISRGATGNKALMSKSNYKGMLHAVMTIWKQEGLTGFYKGLGSSLLLVCGWGVPFSCLWIVALSYLLRLRTGFWFHIQQAFLSSRWDLMLGSFLSRFPMELYNLWCMKNYDRSLHTFNLKATWTYLQ